MKNIINYFRSGIESVSGFRGFGGVKEVGGLGGLSIKKKSVNSYSIPTNGIFGSLFRSDGDFNNWVFVCIDKISEVISKTEFKLMKVKSDGSSEEVLVHDFLDIFHKPNKYQTLRDFLYIISTWLELDGNVYILKDTKINKTELRILNSKGMRIKINKRENNISEYIFQEENGQTKYSPDDIIHIKYPDPFNDFLGSGTIQRISQWIDIDKLSVQFSTYMFKNGSVLGGIIETDTNKKEELQEIARSFRDRYTGVDKSGETPVLPKGVKYNPLASSPRDMEVNQAEKVNVDRILKAFGLSRGVLGEVDGNGRANVEMEREMFLGNTILPKLERLTDYLTQFLLKNLFPKENLYLDFVSPVPADKKFQLEEIRASLGGKAWKTINEVRQEQGLGVIKGGDEISQFPSLELSAKNKVSGKVPYSVRKNLIEEEKMEETISKISDDVSNSIMEANMEEAHKTFVFRVEKEEEELKKKIIAYDKEIEKEVLKKVLATKKMVKYERGEEELLLLEEEEYLREKNELLNVKEYQKGLSFILLPILWKIVSQEGKIQFDKIPSPKVSEFNSEDKILLKGINNIAKLRNRLFSETTQKLLLAEIKEFKKNGGSHKDLEKRMKDVFSITQKYRAKNLARDLAFSTANSSINSAMIQSGVVKTKIWYTSRGSNVCPFCEYMDGKVIDVEKNFFKKGDKLRIVGGRSLDIRVENKKHPPLHVGCNCGVNVYEVVE